MALLPPPGAFQARSISKKFQVDTTRSVGGGKTRDMITGSAQATSDSPSSQTVETQNSYVPGKRPS